MPQKPSDSTLNDRIEYRLETSPVTDPYDLKVKVDASSVWLTGTPATAPQKAEAGRLARVDGVSTVENDIAIDKNVDRTLADRAKAGMTKTGETITDAWITTKVKWFFVGEDLLKGSDINVDTDKHVVTIKGSVTSGAGRDRAVALARRTGGVLRVVDQLTIIAN
jgi:hyperosmotically inducible periplasmic protein